VLWKRLRHQNLLPFYGVYMADSFGIVSPLLENGNIVTFTLKNPEVNRLRLVRRSHQFTAELFFMNVPRQMIEAASGLEFLHRATVTHGNLRGVSHFPHVQDE